MGKNQSSTALRSAKRYFFITHNWVYKNLFKCILFSPEAEKLDFFRYKNLLANSIPIRSSEIKNIFRMSTK